jgi:hypothetical protein
VRSRPESASPSEDATDVAFQFCFEESARRLDFLLAGGGGGVGLRNCLDLVFFAGLSGEIDGEETGEMEAWAASSSSVDAEGRLRI